MRWKVIHVVEIFWYVAETRRSVMFPGSPSAWNFAGDIEYAQVKARVLRMDRVMVGWTYEKRRETYWLLHKQTEEKGPPCLSLPNWSNEHNLCFMMYLSSWCVRREAKDLSRILLEIGEWQLGRASSRCCREIASTLNPLLYWTCPAHGVLSQNGRFECTNSIVEAMRLEVRGSGSSLCDWHSNCGWVVHVQRDYRRSMVLQ